MIVPVESLGAKSCPSPLYDAMTACVPNPSSTFVSLATPSSSGLLPSVVLPSKNVTVPPVGTAAPGGRSATVAVKLTGWL